MSEERAIDVRVIELVPSDGSIRYIGSDGRTNLLQTPDFTLQVRFENGQSLLMMLPETRERELVQLKRSVIAAAPWWLRPFARRVISV